MYKNAHSGGKQIDLQIGSLKSFVSFFVLLSFPLLLLLLIVLLPKVAGLTKPAKVISNLFHLRHTVLSRHVNIFQSKFQ